MTRFSSYSFSAWPLLVLATLASTQQPAHGAGLNTDVALTPPSGGTIVRAQWRYSELSGDRTPLGRTVKLSIQPITVVHGLSENLAILGTVPIVHRELDFASGATANDTGIGDITLLAKYRFYQDDEFGRTTRWAVIGGAEIPSYDEPFSSESLDPIIGTVWTHQRLDWWVDWDVLYKFNTAGGSEGDDELRFDAAYSHRLWGDQTPDRGPWALYAVAELNSNYVMDGSTQVFLSPGLQFITSNVILETGVQLPVHQDLKAPRLEADFTVAVSLRIQF